MSNTQPAERMKKYVAINEKGRRVGENHHRANLSDEQVDRIRDLHEDHDLSYQQLAKMYNVSKQTIASICQYARRAQTPFGFKTLEVDSDV
jgi:ribosome-binding protein aMBF1 (putative translation factor)